MPCGSIMSSSTSGLMLPDQQLHTDDLSHYNIILLTSINNKRCH